MTRRKLAAAALSLALAAGAGVAPFAGCNGTGVTPTCAFPDGAFDPESGCGQPVEAAVPEDAVADQAATEDTGSDVTGSQDASDGSNMDASDGEKARDGDAGERDGPIADGRSDAKG